MFERIKASLGGLIRGSSRSISMISAWMANAVWTIEAKFLPLAQQAFKQNEVLFSCLRLLSQSVPEPPLIAYTRNDTGVKKPLPYNHDLPQLIRRPNELMTEYEFWELTTLHLAIVGKSYWWEQRQNSGRIKALWPLRPDRVGPHYSLSDEDGKRVIDGFVYQAPGSGELMFIPRNDMLFFKFPDIAGESGGIVEGFGPVQVLANQIAADNEATKFVGALLANYAAPTVALRMKAPIKNEAQADLIKSKFRHEFGGANRGTPALLDAETEIQIIGFNMQQLEFPELRNTSEARIASTLGVPAILAGLKVGLVAGNNRASVTEQRAYFAETTLSNYWRRLQNAYTIGIAAEYGDDIICEFDILQVHAMAAHFKEKVAPIRDAFKDGSASRNEYRSALNLQLLESEMGDMFIMPLNTAQIRPNGEIVMIQSPQGPIEPGQEKKPQQGKKPDAKPEEKPKPEPMPTRKAIKALEDEEAELAALLAAFLAGYYDKAASAILGGTSFDYTAFEVELRLLLELELMQIAMDEAERQAALLGVGFDPAEVQQRAYKWAQQYVPAMVAGLVQTTRDALQEIVAQYAANPTMTKEELMALLVAVFGDVRVELISISENSAAVIAGAMVAIELLRRLNIKKIARYRTSQYEKEKTCPICKPLDGRLETQAGFQWPPRHGRCRCRVVLEDAA